MTEQLQVPAQTDAQRRTALIAGVFFAITFVTSIPALILYQPLLKHTDYIFGSGARAGVALGATLEVFLAISGIATAVVLYPILKRQSQSISLGYVASRTLESAVIVIGVVSVLLVAQVVPSLDVSKANDSVGFRALLQAA